MSGKSIFYSILSVVLYGGAIFFIATMFSQNIGFGFLSILTLLVPAFFHRSAVANADGLIDGIIAKFVVPALMVGMGIAAIFGVGFWIKYLF